MYWIKNIIGFGIAIVLIAAPAIGYSPVHSVVNTKTDIVLISNEKYVNQSDLYWLAKIVSAEARGESLQGQIAVANVVLNRVNSKMFPDTVQEVIFQPGQFCPVSTGSLNSQPTSNAIKAAEYALQGVRVVPENVMFFYNPDLAGKRNWIRTREIVKRIGNHVFATSRGR